MHSPSFAVRIGLCLVALLTLAALQLCGVSPFPGADAAGGPANLGFESGTLAAAIGPVAAVVVGGIGALCVVAATASIWPEMRRLGRL